MTVTLNIIGLFILFSTIILCLGALGMAIEMLIPSSLKNWIKNFHERD